MLSCPFQSNRILLDSIQPIGFNAWPCQELRSISLKTEKASRVAEQEFAHVRVKKTKIGQGVFASQSFEFEETIDEIDGKVMSLDHESNYGMDLDGEAILEPYAPFRFLNHSCEPNCELVLWKRRTVKGKKYSRMWLVALRDIDPGEELTIDYAWPEEDTIPCLCGTKSCRGYVVAAS